MYSDSNRRTGRERFLHQFTLLINQILLHQTFFYQSLIGVSLSLLPAIVIGCSGGVLPEEGTIGPSKSRITLELNSIKHSSTGSTLDILVFNDDRLKRLDSYQRIEYFDSDIAYASSTGGDKIFFLYYGSRDDRYGWAQINSLGSLSKICSHLEDECRDNPVMTGQCRCAAGENATAVELAPLSCMICLTHLQCDFSGTAYANSTVTNVRAYLTNVNATCSIAPEASGSSRLINVGMLNPDDLKGFSDRSIVMQEITDRLGIDIQKTDVCFLCYPNSQGKGRDTRLVIEGQIDGETYYWPIEVGEGDGIARNCLYSYSILLRRKGTSDPDILIDRRDVELEFKVKPWEEKDSYYVGF